AENMSERLLNFQPLEFVGTIFKNASAVVGGHAINVSVSILSSVLLVRYLGSERLGQYSALYAYLAIFSWITTLGIEPILVRKATQMQDQKRQVIGNGLVLSVFLSALATVLAVIFSVTTSYAKGFQWMLLIAAVDFLFLTPLRTSAVVFQIQLNQWYKVAITVSREIAWVIVLVLVITFKGGLFVIVLSRLLCSLAEGVAMFIVSRRFIKFNWYWKWSLSLEIIKEAWPLTFAALTGLIYMRIDQVLLFKLSSAKELGYYAAAVRLAELPTILPAAIMTAMLTVLSKVVDKEELFNRYMNIAFRSLAILIFGICTFVALGATTIITLPFGKEYLPSARVLSVLIWSEVGLFLNIAICIGLTAKGMQKYVPISTAAGAILNFILNIFFIPRWGIMGATWATVISYNVSGFVVFIFVPAVKNLALRSIRAAFLPFFCAFICMVFLFHLPKMISMILSLVIYPVLLFIFGALRMKDIRLLWSKDNV
ncbi:MAG: flippase, partial [Candidatus Omnitrophica bacterium]|nr:flippase [Candidatus Omnitrophota bacterium]